MFRCNELKDNHRSQYDLKKAAKALMKKDSKKPLIKQQTSEEPPTPKR